MTACDRNSGGCELKIIHDEEEETKARSKARAIYTVESETEPMPIHTGPPQTLADVGYLKYLMFDIGDITYTVRKYI